MDESTLEQLNTILAAEFERLNAERFEGKLPAFHLRFSRKSCRVQGSINLRRRSIRISLPMFEQHGWPAVVNTLLHEMTHALMHEEGKGVRHGRAFWSEFMKRGGVRDKLNVEPKDAYVYACKTCQTEYKRVRKLKRPWLYSCKKCDSRYNPFHRLYLKRKN